MDWLDLLAVQGTLKSLLQHHDSKVSSSLVLSLLYGPILTSIHDCWKNHNSDFVDLCQQRNVSAFNMLSRFVIAFLPRSKHLLISWLQSPSTVIWETPKHKVSHCFHFSPSICHEVMGSDAMILVFWMLSFKPAFSLSSFTFINMFLGKKVMTNRDRVWWRTGKPSLLQSIGSQTDMTWQLNSNKSAFNNLWSWIVNDILPCDLIHEFSPSKLSAPRNKNCFISFCFFHA